MIETNGSVISEVRGGTEESMLFTYDPEEQERNQISSENAKLLFTPEFIPYYPAIAREFNLSDFETILYGFIRFFMARGGDSKFYFTDKQLAEMFDKSEKSISVSIKNLSDKGLIKKSSKMRAGGGTTRFITQIAETCSHRQQNPTISNSRKLLPNYNILNNNNINIKEKTTVVEETETLMEPENKLNTYKKFIKNLDLITKSAAELYPNKNIDRALEDFKAWCETSKASNNTKDYKLRFYNWVREDRYKQYDKVATRKEVWI